MDYVAKYNLNMAQHGTSVEHLNKAFEAAERDGKADDIQWIVVNEENWLARDRDGEWKDASNDWMTPYTTSEIPNVKLPKNAKWHIYWLNEYHESQLV